MSNYYEVNGDPAILIERISVTGVNAATTGATLVGTTRNNGKNWYTIGIDIGVASASGVTTVAVINIGTNSTSYNNILLLQTLTGLNSILLKSLYLPIAACAIIPPNTGIYTNISTAIIGTSQTLNISLLGYYGS